MIYVVKCCNKNCYKTKIILFFQLVFIYPKIQREKPLDLLVNSVHWKAINGEYNQNIFTLTAKGYSDSNITNNNRCNKKMMPSDCIEAFEAKYGVPILGVQWHPEAYYNNPDKSESTKNHQQLVKYMSLAGASYTNKRNMLKQLLHATSPC